MVCGLLMMGNYRENEVHIFLSVFSLVNLDYIIKKLYLAPLSTVC